MSMFELSSLTGNDRAAFFYLVELQDRWNQRAETPRWWNISQGIEVEVWIDPKELEYVTRGDNYLFSINLMWGGQIRWFRIPSDLSRESWIYRTILDDPDEAFREWPGSAKPHE